MDRQLKKQLREVLTIGIPTATIDIAGVATMTTATIPCRVETDLRTVVVGRSEVEGRSFHRVWVDASDFTFSDLAASDLRYILPNETAYRRPYIVQTFTDERGRRDFVELVI
jgi:hypothetical protein